MKILLVDDEQEIIDFLSHGLNREGFEVVCAGDGKEAQAQVIAYNPGIIVLDIVMPEVDGWDFLNWLRHEHKSTIPVIVLSAAGAMEDMRKGYDMQANHYLIKPVAVRDLVKAINTLGLLSQGFPSQLA
jgi:DNA-binding response OmpR family regulator